MMTTAAGFSAASMNQFSSALLTYNIDGMALAGLTEKRLDMLGVAIGDWTRLLQLISDNEVEIAAGLLPNLDPCSIYFGKTLPMFIDYYLSALTGVDDRLYQFEQIFWFNLVWHDDRQIYFPPASTNTIADCSTLVMSGAPACFDSLWGVGDSSLTTKVNSHHVPPHAHTLTHFSAFLARESSS
jgi:hypothetical protein